MVFRFIQSLTDLSFCNFQIYNIKQSKIDQMQGRSLSKQNRPQGQQMTAYQEAAGGQHYNVPTSISARKYPRDQHTVGTGSTQKLTAPIKSLQQKHKHLEMQLAKLSAEVANQNGRGDQPDVDHRRKYIKPASGAPQINYASPMDLKGQHPGVKARITSKDRSNSGNKRFKPSNINNLKVTSPQRSDKMVLGSQGSTSKLDRQRQINDIIGHLKKNSQGQVMVKLANKGTKNAPGTNTSSQNYIGHGASGHQSINTQGLSIQQQHSLKVQRSVGAGNSAKRQYYAGSGARTTDVGGDPGQIDLSSQQHNVSVSNGSQRATNNNFSNTVGMGGLPHPSDADLNQQLINLQGNTAQMVNPLGHEDDQNFGEAFGDAAITPIARNQPFRAASGPRFPQQNQANLARHFDAPQPYPNLARNQVSPDKAGMTGQNSLFYRNAPQTNNFVNDSNQTNDMMQSSSGFQQQPLAPNSEIVRNLEVGILSLHGHLKTLEGKYIDLANYYKQELISSNQVDGEEASGTNASSQAKMRPNSSSTGQRKALQGGSAKRTASRENSVNNQYLRKTNSQLQEKGDSLNSKRTPRLDGRSFSKGSGLRNFEEYKDAALAANKGAGGRTGRGLDQAEERSIIEEVKSQKQKLEGEMRNLINLYSQICEEDVKGNSSSNLRQFQSRYSTNAEEYKTVGLNQILFKYQNQLLTQSEYQESFEKSVEKTFDELFEELSEHFQISVAEARSQRQPATGRLPSLPLMDRIEKLGTNYEIQQEYSLQNLKETSSQIKHANKNLQLDLNKIGHDFSQIQKKLLDQERGLLAQLSDSQDNQSLDDLIGSLDLVSNGLNSMSHRVSQNDQKLRILKENHGESVRYLREYRENFRRISSEYALASSAAQSSGATGNQNMIGELSGDQMSVNQSYTGLQGNSKYQTEIMQLNEEIFHLRARLTNSNQNGQIDLKEIQDKLDQLENLKSENASLHGQVTDMNQDLVTKTNQLTARDAERADLIQALQSHPVQIQQAQIFEDFWRQHCQSMVDLSQKFLHSMRRLQKVVHRKESNVQQEKQDFETAKKELELNLKEVKRQLENQPQMGIGLDASTDPRSISALTDANGRNPGVSTSARPFIQHDQVGSFNQGNHAQSMRVHQPSHMFSTPGQPVRPPMGLDEASIHKQSTDQSKVDQLTKQLAELKQEGVTSNKKLAKERQKNQQLLGELKLSQENLQKFKLTFVPQENVSDLESSVKQLQDTIKGHEMQDQQHAKLIGELKMTVNDKQMNIYELTRLANDSQNQAKPDYQKVLSQVMEQVNEVISNQASWLLSIEQHLANKEQQMVQMVEAVDFVSKIVSQKNDSIKILLEENIKLTEMVQSKEELVGLAQNEAGQANRQLSEEVSQLRSDLHVRKNGNVMMNALMRGFKLKLEEEMDASRRAADDQAAQIKQFSSVVQQQNKQVATLQAKIDKKKFKSTQQKQSLATTEQSQAALESKVVRAQQKQQQVAIEHENLQAEAAKLRGDLHVRKNGNVMMNALMRGLKLKLDEKMAESKQIIDSQVIQISEYEESIHEQTAEIEEFSKMVQTQGHQVKTLSAKLEKKKFKQAETKKVLATNSHQLSQLQSRMSHDDAQRDEDRQQLQVENEQLRSTLHVKKNGNVMMNAIMRAFKQKLEESKAQQDKLVEEQQNEIKSFTTQVQVSNEEVRTLRAKVEKKKFKTGQFKQHIAKVQTDQEAIFGAKRQVEEQLGQAQAEKATTAEQLQEMQSEMIELQALHDQKESKCSNLEQRIAQIQDEKEELLQATQTQLNSLVDNEKAKGDRLSESVSRLQQELEYRDAEIQRLEDDAKSLQSQTQSQSEDQQALRKEHLKDLEQARQKQAKQTLETATVEQLEGANNQSAMFEIKELRIENQQQKQINEQRDAQATDYNNKLTESNLIASQLQNQLDSAINDAKAEATGMNRELENLQAQLDTIENKNAQLKEELAAEQDEGEQNQKALEETLTEVNSLEERIEALNLQHETFKVEQDQIQKDLRQDRDTAQAQMSEFVNQNKFEKESLEGKLQNALNQTQAQLDTKEDECEELQRQLTELKEGTSQKEIELNEITQKLEKKKMKVTEMRSVKDGQDEESRGDKAALEQSRELVVQFKAKLQADEDMIAAKDEEIKTLRSKVELQTAEIAEKENKIIEHEDDLNTQTGELQGRTDEITRALSQVDTFQVENERLIGETKQFKDQIAQLKLEFQAKAEQLETEASNMGQKVKEQDEMIAEADNLLAEFNNEKHEVKAKFKHLMSLLNIKATDPFEGDEDTEGFTDRSPNIIRRLSNPSSYKGREGEVDLNHCFEELEQIVLEFKNKQESRIVDLISDKEQLTGTVHEQKQDLEAMQISLAALQEKLDDANGMVEVNDGEARVQIDTAMRKIQNYKTKLTEKKTSIADFEAQIAALTTQLLAAQTITPGAKNPDISDSGMLSDSSKIQLEKENMQLFERLQKAESKLQKVRSGESFEEEEEAKGGKITLSPEVAEKLVDIDSRMVEIKRELHQAKSSCLRDLTSKLQGKVKTAQKTFAEEHLLRRAVTGDKITGWNNIVRECKAITFAEKHFILVQDVSETEFYLVDLDRVTETATKYLKAFIEEYDDDEFIKDVVGENAHDLDDDPEIEKLKALVTDLRQDRIELQAELEQFREGVSDKTRISKLKDEEMKDDIEYLTGENKELHLKVKDVCVTNANLKLQIALKVKQLRVQEEQKDMSAIVVQADMDDVLDASPVESARNTGLDGEMFEPVEEMKDESSRHPDRGGMKEYMYEDGDSAIDIVNQMDEEEDESARSSTAFKAQLQRLELENIELKKKLALVNNQVQEMADKQEEDDEDSGKSLIPHIKVSLIQFMRNVALTDRSNEDILSIIFRMMEFTDTEIQELKIARLSIKMVKGKPQRAASSSVHGPSQHSNNSLSKDDDGSGKPKRGLFGMFGNKKKQDANSSANRDASGGLPPSLKPVQRR